MCSDPWFVLVRMTSNPLRFIVQFYSMQSCTIFLATVTLTLDTEPLSPLNKSVCRYHPQYLDFSVLKLCTIAASCEVGSRLFRFVEVN